MNKETYGALKRIIEEVKEKRNATCLMKDCIVNHIIGGNDIDLIEGWIDEVAKEYQEEDERSCRKCGKTSGLLEDDDICYTCAKERGLI